MYMFHSCINAIMSGEEEKCPAPQAKKLKLDSDAHSSGLENVEKHSANLKHHDQQIEGKAMSKLPDQQASSETPDQQATDEGSAISHHREEDVGITEYISTHPGFFGILKQRSAHNILSSALVA